MHLRISLVKVKTENSVLFKHLFKEARNHIVEKLETLLKRERLDYKTYTPGFKRFKPKHLYDCLWLTRLVPSLQSQNIDGSWQ